MPKSVANELSQLTFTGGPVETIYLNELRVRDDFLGQIGAIDSFTSAATKKGQLAVALPFLSGGGGVGASQGVQWSLSEPTAQALVLRAALESRGQLKSLSDAAPGSYVLCEGRCLLSRPGMMDTNHGASLPDGLYEEFELERAEQEEVARLLGHGEGEMYLLTIQTDTALAAAILHDHWLRPSVRSWLGSAHRWSVLARARGEDRRGYPLLAAIFVTVVL